VLSIQLAGWMARHVWRPSVETAGGRVDGPEAMSAAIDNVGDGGRSTIRRGTRVVRVGERVHRGEDLSGVSRSMPWHAASISMATTSVADPPRATP
jgi:hypothetical protein